MLNKILKILFKVTLIGGVVLLLGTIGGSDQNTISFMQILHNIAIASGLIACGLIGLNAVS